VEELYLRPQVFLAQELVFPYLQLVLEELFLCLLLAFHHPFRLLHLL
jgi:hypothetical protein